LLILGLVMAFEVRSMNSFRDSITQGRGVSGPVMPAKKSPRSKGDSLSGLQVQRAETRTHNQRTEPRQILAAEEARLLVGRRNYVVDVLNLSGGGAMIRTNVPLKLWKQVHLELADGDALECAVRWIREDRIGLEFAHETQVAGDAAKRDAMLLDTIGRNFPEVTEEPAHEKEAGLAPGGADAQRRAGLRHPLIWSGEIHFDHDTTRVRLRNVSETGAMVDCPRPFPEGAEVLLDLGGGGQHFASVTWSRGDQLGLHFKRPFDIACLAKAKPEVAPKSWDRPEYLSAGQDTDSPWAEPWERLSLNELKDELEGFLKR
jgi:hypothetical protein